MARRPETWSDILRKLGPIERVIFDGEDVWSQGRAPAWEILEVNQPAPRRRVDFAEHLTAAMTQTKKIYPKELIVGRLDWETFIAWNDDKVDAIRPWIEKLDRLHLSFTSSEPGFDYNLLDRDRNLTALVKSVPSSLEELSLHWHYLGSTDHYSTEGYELTLPWPERPFTSLQRLALTGFSLSFQRLIDELAEVKQTLRSLELENIVIWGSSSTIPSKNPGSFRGFFEFAARELHLENARFRGLYATSTFTYDMDDVAPVLYAGSDEAPFNTVDHQLALAVLGRKPGAKRRAARLDESKSPLEQSIQYIQQLFDALETDEWSGFKVANSDMLGRITDVELGVKQ
jgi:hypothetical protein